MKENIVKDKSFKLAIRIVRLFQYLQTEKKEFIISKQLLRSGTAVGAMVREAEHAESKADFVHKMAIAQKECNETLYWLELLMATQYLTEHEFMSICEETTEIIKLITSIVKSAKS
ncbi:MAG TPA: four helix bundle protein [Bacteroidales bacterium]